MSHWWRAHDEAVDDPKLQRLAPTIFKAWFNLMCIASGNEGVLPEIGDVAFKLHLTEHKAAEVIATLVAAKLFDLRADGKFEPHNWSIRQFKSDVTDPTVAERMRRYRKNRNAVTENTVTVTLTRDREQTTETEKKEPSLRSGTRAKPSTAFPEGNWLTEEDRESARKHGISNIDGEFERFRDHALAKGRVGKNWHAAWRNWCASPYQKPQQNQQQVNGHGRRSGSLLDAIDKVEERIESSFDSPPSEDLIRRISSR